MSAIPLILHCPQCHERHIDEGENATREHRTHACQSCGVLWAPAIVSTVGVRFLPGCKDEPSSPSGVADVVPTVTAATSLSTAWYCNDCKRPVQTHPGGCCAVCGSYNTSRVIARNQEPSSPAPAETPLFRCPQCSAEHRRGFVDGVSVFRCMRCGYSGHGFSLDPEVDAQVYADHVAANKLNAAVGVPVVPLGVDPLDPSASAAGEKLGALPEAVAWVIDFEGEWRAFSKQHHAELFCEQMYEEPHPQAEPLFSAATVRELQAERDAARKVGSAYVSSMQREINAAKAEVDRLTADLKSERALPRREVERRLKNQEAEALTQRDIARAERDDLQARVERVEAVAAINSKDFATAVKQRDEAQAQLAAWREGQEPTAWEVLGPEGLVRHRCATQGDARAWISEGHTTGYTMRPLYALPPDRKKGD